MRWHYVSGMFWLMTPQGCYDTNESKNTYKTIRGE